MGKGGRKVQIPAIKLVLGVSWMAGQRPLLLHSILEVAKSKSFVIMETDVN